jgi:L-lactate dehydrogenase complex protein LldF
VYKNVGGFAYGWFISGPIGAIFAPQMLGTQTARELPYASTLCGACADVCPVKIPIPTILRHLRRRVAQGDEVAEATLPVFVRTTAGLASLALAQNWIYRFGALILPTLMSIFKRGEWISGAPYPLNRWTNVRPLPPFTAKFRQWWNARSASGKESNQ